MVTSKPEGETIILLQGGSLSAEQLPNILSVKFGAFR